MEKPVVRVGTFGGPLHRLVMLRAIGAILYDGPLVNDLPTGNVIYDSGPGGLGRCHDVLA